jgi:flavin reductase (DIM6/NTAB) family NADH-FMN oxidoreductase RutF
MLLACVNRRSPMSAAIEANREFCVNELSVDQVPLSQVFSGRSEAGRAYDMESAEWLDGQTLAKRLKGAVASFDCLLNHIVALGTHYVFIGLVVGVCYEDGRPLLYSRRGYHVSCSLDNAGDLARLRPGATRT